MLQFGWLSRSEFYPCDIMDHVWEAERLCREYGYVSVNSRPDDVLMDHGWVHITRSAFSGEYRIYWDKHLNEYQKSFLRPYMESGNIEDFCLREFRYEENEIN